MRETQSGNLWVRGTLIERDDGGATPPTALPSHGVDALVGPPQGSVPLPEHSHAALGLAHHARDHLGSRRHHQHASRIRLWRSTKRNAGVREAVGHHQRQACAVAEQPLGVGRVLPAAAVTAIALSYVSCALLAAWWLAYWANLPRRWWGWAAAFGATIAVWVVVGAVAAVLRTRRVVRDAWRDQIGSRVRT